MKISLRIRILRHKGTDDGCCCQRQQQDNGQSNRHKKLPYGVLVCHGLSKSPFQWNFRSVPVKIGTVLKDVKINHLWTAYMVSPEQVRFVKFSKQASRIPYF